MTKTLFIIDDDSSIRIILQTAFEGEGWQVFTANDIAQAQDLLTSTTKADVILSDVLMPSGSGLDLFDQMKQHQPNAAILFMSAHATMDMAIDATNKGAVDYIAKPFDLNNLIKKINANIKHSNGIDSSSGHTIDFDSGQHSDIIGKSPVMQKVFRTISRIAKTDLSVVIHGESGTGKELVAKTIHQNSPRANEPFIAMNMAAIPNNLIESELFGHEKGAFTGANQRRIGQFQLAEGGTLFLDEIGDMPLEAQTRLLRVLQENEFRPLGSNQVFKTNVRIICASHKKLENLIRQGLFREDLFFRLNIIHVDLPPLRERGHDIKDLFLHFLNQQMSLHGEKKHITDDAVSYLMALAWPGNIRELDNAAKKLFALVAEPEITLSDVQEIIVPEMSFTPDNQPQKSLTQTVEDHIVAFFGELDGRYLPTGLYTQIMRDVERPLIDQVLKVTRGNQIKAADILGINRNTLRKKITELDINPHQHKRS